jgi:nicotinamide mononucleotide transporter PnuC
MSAIEIAGVLVSALAIWLTARRKMACWPVGLLSVALYGWIFFDAKLYSDMLLQGAFAVMQVYGWWRWLVPAASGGAADAPASVNGGAPLIDVRPASTAVLLRGLLAGVIGSVLLGGVMAHLTDAALPWVDASLSAFSLVAQYWTARRYIASWVLWVVVDCIYVGMFVFKDLYPTSLLYAFFVALAVAGWRDWHRAVRKQDVKPNAKPEVTRHPAPRDGRSGSSNARIVAGGKRSEGSRNSVGGMRRADPAMAFTSTGTNKKAGKQGERKAPRALMPMNDGADVQFGVNGEQAERDWPLMIVSEVASVLASFPVGGSISHLSWHSPRPFAAAVLATMSGGETLFIKRHHIQIRDVEALSEEHRFIAHLAAHGVPVVSVLPDRLGRTAVAIGEWTYEVHRVADGVDVYRSVMSWEPFRSVHHAEAAGSALAQLHLAARDYDAPARPPRLLLSSFAVIGTTDLMGSMTAWVERQPLLSRALAKRNWQQDVAAVVGPYHARLVPLLDALPSLWTHGDWHASNLLWTGAGSDADVRSVLDFGLADRSCAVYDLALAIERNTIEWLLAPAQRAVHLDQVDALLDGYERVLPLSATDYDALIAVLPIAHVEFALSEVAYFDGVLDLPEEADVAYDGYLLGHVTWFGQSAGSALLKHLEARKQRLVVA